MSDMGKITSRNRGNGFRLIEMMIAMTIGLMIAAALTAVVISSGRSSRANDRTSELQSNGRYALDALKRDLQSAGYYGFNGRGVIQPPMALPNDCYAGFASNINQRVWGSNDGVNTFNGRCIPVANYAGSDILVIRYAGLNDFPSNPLVAPPVDPAGITGFANTGANTLYLRSAYGISQLFQKAAIPGFPNQPQRDHIVQVHVYYVAPWSVSAAENPQIPSLRRLVLDNTGAMVDELVASGIENLQVEYGVQNGSSGNTQYFDAQNVNPGIAPAIDSLTPAFDLSGASQNNWGNVNAVRVWLLSRNTGSERNESYINNTQYAMGDVVRQYNDPFRRQLFTTTIQLRN